MEVNNNKLTIKYYLNWFLSPFGGKPIFLLIMVK